MRTTERRPSRRLAAMAVCVVMSAIIPTTSAQAALWQGIEGGTTASDYEVVSSVAFGPDGSFFTVSQRAAPFDGDLDTSSFELVVRQYRLDGELGFETVVGPFGTGLNEVEIGVDGAGDVWLFVRRSLLVVIDSTGAAVAQPADLPPILEDPSTSGTAAATSAGFVVAEPVAGTIRMLLRDGSTAWVHPLDPGISTSVELISAADGATVVVACHDDTGDPGLLIEQMSASGSLVSESLTPGRVPVRSGSDIYLAGQIATRQWADPTNVTHSILVLVAEPSDSTCSVEPDDRATLFQFHPVDGLANSSSATGFVAESACVSIDAGRVLPASNGCGAEEILLDVSTSAFDTSIDAAVSSGRDIVVVLKEADGHHTLARFSAGSAAVPLGELVGGSRLGPGFTVHDVAFDGRGNIAVVGEVSPAAGGSANPRGFVLTNPWAPWFHDVHSDWQIRPIEWLWNTELTTGVAPWLYAPERLLTRAEAATFLHRAVGEPEVSDDHGFVDVVKQWQQAPIRWLKANGITTGVDPTHFAPERPIDRGEFAVMIWRAVGQPGGSPSHGFSDITKPWQEEAIRWLAANEITTGVDPTHFAPDRNLTRAETATFLFRLGMIVELATLA